MLADFDTIIAELRSMANPDSAAGMARFGITGGEVLGVSIPPLRAMAKRIGRDHALASRLWDTGIHEARLLAAFVDDPKQVMPDQMERWVADFDSWDVCDQVCGNLFDKTPGAYERAAAWAERPEEFVRRAGFVLMTQLAVHDKKADDARFEAYFPLIRTYASDGRNFVRKAVNWALLGEEIQQQDSKSARWVAADALRELTSEKTRSRIKK